MSEALIANALKSIIEPSYEYFEREIKIKKSEWKWDGWNDQNYKKAVSISKISLFYNMLIKIFYTQDDLAIVQELTNNPANNGLKNFQGITQSKKNIEKYVRLSAAAKKEIEYFSYAILTVLKVIQDKSRNGKSNATVRYNSARSQYAYHKHYLPKNQGNDFYVKAWPYIKHLCENKKIIKDFARICFHSSSDGKYFKMDTTYTRTAEGINKTLKNWLKNPNNFITTAIDIVQNYLQLTAAQLNDKLIEGIYAPNARAEKIKIKLRAHALKAILVGRKLIKYAIIAFLIIAVIILFILMVLAGGEVGGGGGDVTSIGNTVLEAYTLNSLTSNMNYFADDEGDRSYQKASSNPAAGPKKTIYI